MLFRILPFNTLHRRIFSELTSNFLISAIFLLTLVLMTRAMTMRNLFISLGISITDFVVLLVYMSPNFLLLVMPLSCMLSVFLTLMRMSSDRELVALKAGGIGLMQLLPAPVWFALGCSLVTLALSLEGVPWGSENFRSTLLYLASSKARLDIRPGVFNQEIDGVTVFARQVDPVSGQLRQVIIEDATDKQRGAMLIVAPIGAVDSDKEQGNLIFRLWNGRSYIFEKDNSANVSEFAYFEHHFDISVLFAGFQLHDIRPRDLSWKELRKLQQQKSGDKDSKFNLRLLLELQKRWSLPASCLVLGFFAIPLACSFESSKKQISVVLAILTFFIYYSLYTVGLNLGESGALNPVIAMWLPNALFLVLGLTGLFFAMREVTLDLSALWRRLLPMFRRSRKF
jgi:lipopolysaccharide export system permease protein